MLRVVRSSIVQTFPAFRLDSCLSEAQSEPMEDDELDMDVDEDAEGEEGDDVDIVGDGTHDDEGVVDDKDVVEEDIEDELIDVRSAPRKSCRPRTHSPLGRLGRGWNVLSTSTSRGSLAPSAQN